VRERTRPDYPNFDPLPAGVTPLKHYRSGESLVECAHDREHRVPLTRRDGEMCVLCHATRFDRPVKLLAIVPDVVSLF
jgi:hypothetical protein